jgi:(5-formylfuran-3-yl)methyl phosphate synthase
VTRLLASVRTADEALLAVAGGADIIDAKEPATGALGNVAPETLAAIVRAVAGRRPVSATIGDLPLEPEPVRDAVLATSAAGADIVKIGLFEGDLDGVLGALRPIVQRGVRLVAVLFADRNPDLDGVVARCAEAGFFGAMLDTAAKGAGPLTAHLDPPRLADFVAGGRRRGLVTGLAGSLRLGDVAALAPLGADYLGFRSALTRGGRAGALDPAALGALRAALDDAQRAPRSSATATAGATSLTASPMSGPAPTTASNAL